MSDSISRHYISSQLLAHSRSVVGIAFWVAGCWKHAGPVEYFCGGDLQSDSLPQESLLRSGHHIPLRGSSVSASSHKWLHAAVSSRGLEIPGRIFLSPRVCVLGFSERTRVLPEHALILLPDKEGRIQLWPQKAILPS